MDTIKAVCKCRNMDEANTVLAVKQGRFDFIEKWEGFTWLMVIVLVLATGAFWIGGIIGAHFSDIFNPKYHCNQCDSVVPQKQFRA